MKLLEFIRTYFHRSEAKKEEYNLEKEINRLQQALVQFHQKLETEFGILDLNAIMKNSNGDIGYHYFYPNQIEVNRAKHHSGAVEKLMELPGAHLEYNWIYCDEKRIRFNRNEYEEILRKKLKSPVFKSVLALGVVIPYFKKYPKRYHMLLVKYEDTFTTILSTIEDMKLTSQLTIKAQKTIAQITDSFIDEFLEIERCYEERDLIDKKANEQSLQRRLEDELKLVNMSKILS